MDVIELPGTERVVRVRFRGVVYRRYPLAKHSSDRNYFRAGKGDVAKGRSYLHRDLWATAHGPIPDGHEVDHIDGDPLNNALGNLQLLPEAVHHAKHAGELGERCRARWAAMSDADRDKVLRAAAEWHRSPAGRTWHAEHMRRWHANQSRVSATCDHCGGGYSLKRYMRSRGRFCSNNCKSAARRASGVDDVQRACVCGTAFVANKYSAARHCSRRCARSRAGVQPHGG